MITNLFHRVSHPVEQPKGSSEPSHYEQRKQRPAPCGFRPSSGRSVRVRVSGSADRAGDAAPSADRGGQVAATFPTACPSLRRARSPRRRRATKGDPAASSILVAQISTLECFETERGAVRSRGPDPRHLVGEGRLLQEELERLLLYDPVGPRSPASPRLGEGPAGRGGPPDSRHSPAKVPPPHGTT